MCLSFKAYAKLQFRDLALFKIFASTIRRSRTMLLNPGSAA